MEILPVRKNDREEIINISRRSFEWGDYIEQVFDLWLKEGLFLKAVENNRIVGFIHVRLFKEFSWLEGLRVREDSRRKGVATELTRMAIHLSGKKIIRLMILESNAPSRDLANKLNFMEIDRVYYKMGENMDFESLIKKYGLRKMGYTLKENFVDSWVYFDYFYYDDYIYGNDSGVRLLKTNPPFILNGSIDEENISKKGDGECFIIYEKRLD
jgi:predicted acetyltransferase